jgi:hypothetical protein
LQLFALCGIHWQFSLFFVLWLKSTLYILDSGKPVVEILGGVCPSSADARGGMLLSTEMIGDDRSYTHNPGYLQEP